MSHENQLSPPSANDNTSTEVKRTEADRLESRAARIPEHLCDVIGRIECSIDRLIGSEPSPVSEGAGLDCAPGMVGRMDMFLEQAESQI
tara:strand:+ start:224 stop:490 length:267 start_codon:yes stop_codon:yes gene_type:complete